MMNCSNFFFSCSGITILVFMVFFFCTGTFLRGGGAFRINFVVLGLVGGRGTCLFFYKCSPGPPQIRVVPNFSGGPVIVTSSAGSDICRLLLASLMHSSASSIQNILVSQLLSQTSRSCSSKLVSKSELYTSRDLSKWGEASPIFSGSPPPPPSPAPIELHKWGDASPPTLLTPAHCGCFLFFSSVSSFLDPLLVDGCNFPHLELSSGIFSILAITFLRKY